MSSVNCTESGEKSRNGAGAVSLPITSPFSIVSPGLLSSLSIMLLLSAMLLLLLPCKGRPPTPSGTFRWNYLIINWERKCRYLCTCVIFLKKVGSMMINIIVSFTFNVSIFTSIFLSLEKLGLWLSWRGEFLIWSTNCWIRLELTRVTRVRLSTCLIMMTRVIFTWPTP